MSTNILEKYFNTGLGREKQKVERHFLTNIPPIYPYISIFTEEALCVRLITKTLQRGRSMDVLHQDGICKGPGKHEEELWQ